MRKYAVASVRWHAVQVALTFLATVIGVGFVTSALVLGDTFEEGVSGLIEQLTGDFDLEVRGRPPGNGVPAAGVDPALVEHLAALDDVYVAVPFVASTVTLLDRDGIPEAGDVFDFPTLAYNTPLSDDDPSSARIVDGDWPAAPGEVAVDVHTMSARAWELGDDVGMLARDDEVVSGRIVGTVRLGNLRSLAGITVVLLPYDTALAALTADGRPTGVEVVARDGADVAALADQVRAIAPDSRIRTAATVMADSQRGVQRLLSLLTDGLLAFALLSVLIACFLVYNTFGTLVAQRAHELALLRAVGARRRQVVRIVLTESILIGVAGGIVGVVAGLGFAVALRRVAAALGVSVGGGLAVRPTALATAFAVGVVSVALTAVMPGLRASRGSPAAALSGPAQPPLGTDASRSLLATLLLVVGASGLAGGFSRALPVEVVVVAAAILVCGVLLLLRAVVRPVGRLLRRLRPSPRRTLTALAGAHGSTDPSRTATATGALFVALALAIVSATLVASLQASALQALDSAIVPEISLESRANRTFGERVAATAEALPEVDHVSPYRPLLVPGATGGSIFLGGVDLDLVGEVYRLEPVDGALGAARAEQAVLDVQSAENLGLGVGDELAVRMPSGLHAFPIAAVVDELPFPDLQAVIDNSAFLALGGRSDMFSGYVRLAPGVSVDEGRQALEAALRDDRLVLVADRGQRLDTLAAAFGQLLGVVYLLLVVSVVVALLGVVNTLVLALYERTPELALLRAIGMTRPQMRRMIRWEAAIVTATGVLLGAGVGILAGTAVAASAARLGIVQVVVPWPHVAVAMAVTVLAGMVAGTVPARRAARMDVLEGLVRH